MPEENRGTGGIPVQGTDPAQELTALEAVLRSKVLCHAPTMAKILKYVCLEHLAGRGEEIKEYNIAVEGLGRSPDFDALPR